MLEANWSDAKDRGLYFEHISDSLSDEGFERILMKAITANKPVIIHRFGGFGKSHATQTVPGFLQHRIDISKRRKTLVHCIVQGEGERDIPVDELPDYFLPPTRLLNRIVNVLGFSYVHDISIIQNMKSLKVFEKYDLLRIVATESDNFDEERMNPSVASDCGFTVLSQEGSFTNIHPDTMATFASMERGGSKQWVFIPPTEKNKKIRITWTESDGLGVFEDVFGIDMHDDDFLYVPPEWMHLVYTVRKALMHGGHLIFAETASPNLEATLLQLQHDGLTNDPPLRAYGFLRELVPVMIS